MKRLAAAVIDFYICAFILMFFVMIISFITGAPLRYFIYIFLFSYYAYIFIFDMFFKGISWGKRCMKICVNISETEKLKYSLFHALVKSIGILIWPISILFFVTCGCNMPYDKILDNINKKSKEVVK